MATVSRQAPSIIFLTHYKTITRFAFTPPIHSTHFIFHSQKLPKFHVPTKTTASIYRSSLLRSIGFNRHFSAIPIPSKTPHKKHREILSALVEVEVEVGGVKITRDDVVRENDPTNNVPDSIFSKIGLQLHRRDNHPLGILKKEIYNYFDNNYAGSFNKFDDLCPIVSVKANFDDVLVPPDHVSRSYNDTYYINAETVLRCHTSAHQAELLREGYSHFLVTGDVYRRDSINATHYPVFHQMEGFRVFSPAEWEACGVDGTSYAAMDLKKNLEGLARHLFGNVEMRWVDTYFPFTDPSFELEIYFQGQWMEVLGCGVTEQAILNNNGRPGTTAWAFGLGLERLAMVLFDIPDIRLFWSSDHLGMEPQLRCAKALWSPSTGIIDTHSLMLALQGEAEEHGTTFAFNTSVVRGDINENGIHLHISETKDMHTFVDNPNARVQMILTSNVVINSAGLSATSLARRFHNFPLQFIPNTYYARGCYFTLSETRKVPFSHLIYPVPEDGGLGVHVTLDMGGQVRFGPDGEWMHEIGDATSFLNMFDYTVDATRAERFYPEIRNYYPQLKDGTLRPDYSGIRPKLSGPGQPAADFVIQGKETHGIPGLVNLFGIESPGLTASMAIAKMISVIV